ncbi:Hypothetical protein I595_1948 [Croceitalea dokdonensis DOKDO 023]|uniref:Lipocalin-like domain-containing protein n=1 Tax=Croceitalea dokdonensis DOKDO 023 TaxID=1300341 RepID=A0A0P7AKC8_9FLAO|nr:hypothetical protein [Croceitalea dokdonensis]KPM32298.1 Hypothetical protein I595_1948 [Croceitalea dokdonensis DOKDO 023]
MRYITVLLLFFIVSCSKEDRLVFDASTNQEWRLVSMSGSDGSVTQGESMEWQESYLFRTDGTFTKSRTADGGTLNASGSFERKEMNGEKQLLLNYTEANGIVGSCFGTANETLILDNDEKRLRSTWLACDGPGLIYERID